MNLKSHPVNPKWSKQRCKMDGWMGVLAKNKPQTIYNLVVIAGFTARLPKYCVST